MKTRSQQTVRWAAAAVLACSALGTNGCAGMLGGQLQGAIPLGQGGVLDARIAGGGPIGGLKVAPPVPRLPLPPLPVPAPRIIDWSRGPVPPPLGGGLPLPPLSPPEGFSWNASAVFQIPGLTLIADGRGGWLQQRPWAGDPQGRIAAGTLTRLPDGRVFRADGQGRFTPVQGGTQAPPIRDVDASGRTIWRDPGTGEILTPPVAVGPQGEPPIPTRDPVTGSYRWRDPGTGELLPETTVTAQAPARNPAEPEQLAGPRDQDVQAP